MKETKGIHQTLASFWRGSENMRNPGLHGGAGERWRGGFPESLVVHSGKHVGNFNSKELTRVSNFLCWYSEKRHQLNTRRLAFDSCC